MNTRCGCLLVQCLIFTCLIFPTGCTSVAEEPSGGRDVPNIVVLFADDMGYGDLGCYGNPEINTPKIDGLAAEGTRFTSFYTGSWCVPSRVQLLTGRYRPRVDLGRTSVGGNGGLPEQEQTLAEGLKSAGYATGMAGKWHLGYKKKKFLPPNQGFDTWFGLPYSNDMQKPWVQTDVPLKLYRGTEVVETPVNQSTLTTRYTKETVRFIRNHAGEDPFFFYLAYNMPHLPIHTTEPFRGTSGAGLYGDVIETIDWSVGRILRTLEKQGVRGNTIVFFASDNGPWLELDPRNLRGKTEPWHVGSPGPLRGSKDTTYEGGARVPAIISWPGRIDAGRVTSEIAASPDIYRTLLNAGGAKEPDLILDGHDLMPFLTGKRDASPRDRYFYIRHDTIEAVRLGKWKLRLAGKEPQLFHLKKDPGERYNRAEDRPEKVERLHREMKRGAVDMRIDLSDR